LFGYCSWRSGRIYREGKIELNLQLILKSGEEIETGGGEKVILANEKIHWGKKELGGWLRHNGWILYLPNDAEFNWPVFPFNPYYDAPETELKKAIGRLSVPLALTDQNIVFRIKID